MTQFIGAIDKREYGNSDILSRYEEDERHLEYMAGDPWDILLENLHNTDQELLQFVSDNDYLDSEDIEEIRNQLSEGQLMDFDRSVGYYFESEPEDIEDDYDEGSDISNVEVEVYQNDDKQNYQLLLSGHEEGGSTD